ncbi:MAG: ankyrin repeat domain-containing protein [Betaproteobacteria bacterium]|nr:ankyrin repeat domain-containing protein [Betaproteobacteria bacterium]
MFAPAIAFAQNADMRLISAAESGNVAEIDRLLAAGARVDARDARGRTALLAACHYGHVATVRALLETAIAIDHVNNPGWTALLEAVILGDGGARHTEIVRLLLAKGANSNLPDGQGVTPLAHACQRGQAEIGRLLQGAGAR